MAPPHGRQADSYLHKVALEGFGLWDEYFNPGRRPTQPYDHQYLNNNEFRGPRKPQPFDHYHYDDSGYVRFHAGYIRRAPPIVWPRKPVIDSDKAAQLYGGVVIVDHGIGNRIPRG